MCPIECSENVPGCADMNWRSGDLEVLVVVGKGFAEKLKQFCHSMTWPGVSAYA